MTAGVLNLNGFSQSLGSLTGTVATGLPSGGTIEGGTGTSTLTVGALEHIHRLLRHHRRRGRAGQPGQGRHGNFDSDRDEQLQRQHPWSAPACWRPRAVQHRHGAFDGDQLERGPWHERRPWRSTIPFETVGSLNAGIAAGNTVSGFNSAQISLGPGTVLTINQTAAGNFGGNITGGSGSLVLEFIQHQCALTLSNANYYGGTTTISGGTLVAANTSGSATGTGTVVVNGVRLAGTGTIAGTSVTVSGSHYRRHDPRWLLRRRQQFRHAQHQQQRDRLQRRDHHHGGGAHGPGQRRRQQ